MDFNAFNIASTVIVVGIFAGVALRRRVATHVLIMRICFVADLLLLIAVEVFRGAVETALGINAPAGGINTTMLWMHIPLATLSGVYWFVQLYYGSKILRGQRELLPKHARNAKLFLFLRVGNLVTALFLYT